VLPVALFQQRAEVPCARRTDCQSGNPVAEQGMKPHKLSGSIITRGFFLASSTAERVSLFSGHRLAIASDALMMDASADLVEATG